MKLRIAISVALIGIAGSAQATSTSIAGEVAPLQGAVRAGNAIALEEAIVSGADPNQVDALTRTALHYAAALGRDDMVGRLVQAGALLDIGDKDGFTPLMRAAQNGHILTVRRLLDAGAKANLVNANNHTALDLAVAAGAKEIAEILQ